MSNLLPVKKIYIDSRFKTDDSESNSNFKFQLTRSVHLPKNTVFYIENFVCAHAWFTIEENINDTLFMRINSTDYNIKINAQNYNGDTFAIEIQTKLNGILPNTFTVAFNPQQNNISIAVNNGTQFKVYTNKDLKTRFGTTDAKSTNDILQNYDYNSPVYHQDNTFVSGFLNLLAIRNLYLSSPNLSSYTTLGSKAESKIIKKIPVSSEFGHLIIETFTSTHDWVRLQWSNFKLLRVSIKRR